MIFFSGSNDKGGLHYRKSHGKNRADCVEYFVEVFGYNPLISSQTRVDSLRYNLPDSCFNST